MPLIHRCAALRVAPLLAVVILIVVPSEGAAPQDPQQAEQRARTALQSGRFQEAYVALRPALEADPERPDLWFLLGQIVAGMGQPRRALQAYDNSIALDPDVPSPWFARGIALLALERYEEAASSFERCLELAPAQPEVSMYLGSARLRDDDAEGASAALTAADGSNDPGEVARLRAEALRMLGRNDEAIDVARIHLETDPEHQPVRFELALALLAADRPSDAFIAMRRAAIASPPYPPAVLEYARALRSSDDRGDHAEAAGLYRHSLDHFPADGTMRGELATLYAELGLETDAAAEAARIIEMVPDDAGALLIAGNVLLRIRRAGDALAALEQAAALAPKDALTHHHLGLARAESEQFEEALAAFDDALRLDPLLLDARVEGARAALYIGARDRAIELLEAAGPSIDTRARALVVLGEAYVEASRFEEAVTALERARELEPELRDALYLLARAYRGTGHEDRARAALDAFQSLGDKAVDPPPSPDDAAADRLDQMHVRAAVYVAEGRFNEAIPILESAVAERARDPQLYDLLAAAYEGIGDTERAAEMRRRAAEMRRAPAPSASGKSITSSRHDGMRRSRP